MNWKIKLGIILIIACIPFFGFLVVIPFLHIESKTKIVFTTISFVTGEIVFWSGGILVGKELLQKYKSYFNPKNWFTKKNENEQ